MVPRPQREGRRRRCITPRVTLNLRVAVREKAVVFLPRDIPTRSQAGDYSEVADSSGCWPCWSSLRPPREMRREPHPKTFCFLNRRGRLMRTISSK